MTEHPFQYSVLRYIHDPMTEEFINVGVVLYSKEARYIKSKISPRYSRLSSAFSKEVNGKYYHRVVRHLERAFERLQIRYRKGDLFERDLPDQIEVILADILPPTDASLVFGGYGGGLVADLDNELNRLYDRLVERYVERRDKGRYDEEIWQVYRPELIKRNVISHLSSVTISVPTYSYSFEYAWLNECWHPIETVSFDLVRAKSILDKANKWLGRGKMLSQSDRMGTLHLLLGAPTQATPEIQKAYEGARHNLQENMEPHHEIVEEDEAAEFSERLAEKIGAHGSEV